MDLVIYENRTVTTTFTAMIPNYTTRRDLPRETINQPKDA